MSFIKESYRKQSDTYLDQDKDTALIERYRDWFDKPTVDVWRHKRMLSCLDPFLHTYPESNWLTIGDGNLGTSAIYIEKNGGKCLATDIDIRLLKKAHEMSWISAYQRENAENITVEDSSFDFTFCKESLHHFPRPYLALYEMIRVSKQAVILTEPADWIPGPWLKKGLINIKRFLKKIFNIRIEHHDTGNFEQIGNYIFTISEREIEKLSLAAGLPAVAFRRFHDIYVPGVEKELIDSILHKRIKRQLFFHNILVKLGLTTSNRIATVIFKINPSPLLQKELKSNGFTIHLMPVNPYL